MRLVNFLSNNKDVRKLFGKKEIEITIKQLKGENLTQSQRNVLSRSIRPKLKVIKDLYQFKDEFDIEKNQENKIMINKAKNIILNDSLNDNILAILLFGSFADSTYTKRSDIDICVIFKKDITLKEATSFRIRILAELPDKIDIQVFNILPLKIKQSIAKNHKILYQDSKYDNIDFSIKYLRDNDFFIRKKKIFGELA